MPSAQPASMASVTSDQRRTAAHTLLDAYTAFDPEKGDGEDNERAILLALQRLNIDEHDPAVRALVGAALDLITLMVGTLAEAKNADPAVVTATIRAVVDQAIYGDD